MTHPFSAPGGRSAPGPGEGAPHAAAGAGGAVVFALGANLGDPLGALRAAARALAARLDAASASAVYVTPPEGGADQPPYLNAVVAGRAAMTPREALELAGSLEARAGRARPAPGAARVLDVDVLFVRDAVVCEPDLRVPHPRWRTRDFVVVPLLEVVPDLVDPESGRMVREVAREAGWGPSRFPVAAPAGALLGEETR